MHIVNLSFDKGIFPSVLKDSLVVPIYKSGDYDNPNNYRPITINSSLSKIIERIVFIRLTKFLEKYSKLNNNQYGFVRDKGTKDALKAILDITQKAIDSGDYAIILTIDLAKAFDTLNHKILLNKLNNRGVRGHVNQWFESFITNRYISVKMNGKISNKYLIKMVFHKVQFIDLCY